MDEQDIPINIHPFHQRENAVPQWECELNTEKPGI